MRGRVPHLVIIASSLVGVGAVAVVDLGRSMPGELAAVHGRVEALEGGKDCAACHGGWFETMGDACLACHETIGQHLELNVGMHGRLAAVEADRCSTCHSEHHGARFEMVNRQSFARAGVADPKAFDHGMVGFEMVGRHLELDCSECHEHAEVELLPEGATRFVGLNSDCASCHEDPHEGAMRQACSNCHAQTGFEERHFPRHGEFFPLFGAHAQAGCLDCHEPEGAHSLAAQMAGTSPPGERECAECHGAPHSQAFLSGNARHAQLPEESVCAACHDPQAFAFGSEAPVLSGLQHAQAGFALDAPHDGLECFACHGPEGASFELRHPGREADDCASCHETPHGSQFEGDPFSRGSCVVCHGRERFEPHGFDATMHAEAAIELDGAHAGLECAECHDASEPEGPRLFRGTPDRCESCHDDAHAGFFDGFAAQLASAEGGTCATCHSTEDFAELSAGGFEHAPWTGFDVRGAHAQNACESCHRPSPEPDELGRRFGRVSEHFGDVEGCASCHGDPHGGEFDGPGKPRVVGDRESCSRCHGELSFRELPFGFDHELWTEFELVGRHGQAACSACHAPLRRTEASGRTWERARGTECASCHEDPHGGQFEVEGAVDCGRCHVDSRPFRDVVFRHNLDSRFALDETHAGVECAACHRAEVVAGVEVVRYRPLGSECADCHGLNGDVLRKRGGR